MKIWMAMDPETRRVMFKTSEWGDGDFPPGLRGVGWPRREHEAEPEELAGILRGRIDGFADDEVDRLHRDWWDAAGPVDGPKWPLLPEGN